MTEAEYRKMLERFELYADVAPTLTEALHWDRKIVDLKKKKDASKT
jgi:hypothetical protein